MKTQTKTTFLLILFLATVLLLLGACSNGPQGPSITVEEPWARQSPMAMGNGAAYMIIKNSGNEADTLTGASTGIANVAELHETTMENDVMRMRPVEGQRIEIPAGGQVELKPGGLHVMLMDLKQQINPGDTFELTLQFEKSGEQKVQVEVRSVEGMTNMQEERMEQK